MLVRSITIAASAYRRRSGRRGYWWLVVVAIVLGTCIMLAGISVLPKTTEMPLRTLPETEED